MVAAGELGAVGIAAAEVEEVDARKGDEEATKKGDGVDGFCCVETTEEDEGCAECSSRKGYVVERVDAGCSWLARNFNLFRLGRTHMLVGNWLSALLK